MLFSLYRKSLIALSCVFVTGLLTACSGQAMSLFRSDNLEWVNVSFENATEDKVFDVYVQWCKYRYLTQIPGIQMDLIPGGGGETSTDYCTRPVTVFWTDGDGKKWTDTIALDQKTFPELGRDQYGGIERYFFIVTVHEDHATVTAHVGSRELTQARAAIIYERRDRYYAKELQRLKPYLEKAKQDYADWEVANVLVSTKQAFDYRQGNTLVKLFLHDAENHILVNAKGEKIQNDEVQFLGSFKRLERYRKAYKDYKKVLDIRMMPGQLERKLELYNQRSWNHSEGKITDSLLKRLAEEYGFEVRISELKLTDE